MNRSEKAYGGYSTHSLPTRNAEDNIATLLDIYATIEKFDDPKIVDVLMANDYDTAIKMASNETCRILIGNIQKHSARVKQARDRIIATILNEKRRNKIMIHEPMNGDVVIQLLLAGDWEGALDQADHPKSKEVAIEVKNLYIRLINKLGLRMVG
jgi:hypothetical protein